MKRIKKLFLGTLIALPLIYLILIIVAYLPYETTPIEELAGEQDKFIEVNGHTIHYTKQGTGKPLILSQPDTSYWRLGEPFAKAWNIGKKYKANKVS